VSPATCTLSAVARVGLTAFFGGFRKNVGAMAMIIISAIAQMTRRSMGTRV
jgi:hypothetical protein